MGELLRFQKWYLTDYTQANGFADGINFGEKEPLYSSQLALNGSIFNPGEWCPNYESLYHLRNFDHVFPPGSPIPGPFDYNKGINLWGNDQVYEMGIYKYAIIICTFGNSRIHNAMIVNEMKSVGSSSPSSEAIVNRLPGESIRIFQWYAKLIRDDGSDVHYDSATPRGTLLDMFKQLITTTVPINPQQIIGLFRQFNATFFNSNPLLGSIVSVLENYLAKLLRNGEIPFLPWKTISTLHAKYSVKLYDYYHAYYDALVNNPEHVHKARERLNRHSYIFSALSYQFCAFFASFYAAVAFLDTALNISGDTTRPAIPPEHLFARIKAVYSYLQRYWVEHMSFMRDFNMILARKSVLMNCLPGTRSLDLDISKLPKMEDLDDLLYKIKITIVESCDSLAMTLSVIFRDFNWINDFRHVLEKLPPSFPPMFPMLKC